MPFLAQTLSTDSDGNGHTTMGLQAKSRPRPSVLVINPNSTERSMVAEAAVGVTEFPGTAAAASAKLTGQAFTRSMRDAITSAGLASGDVAVDFYTAPADTAPASIEGTHDSVVSCAAVLKDLEGRWGEWDGYVIACFSAHPLVPAIREIALAPVVGILEAPLLLASQISASVGILTTSPRWVPILEHDLHILHLSAACSAGVVSSGMRVLELETLPREQVIKTLCDMARDELVRKRGASAIVLGCAGMAGLKGLVEQACGEGVRVVDPVECGVEVCKGLVRLRMTTSKVGMYA